MRTQRAKNYFCNVLHPFGTETYVFARQLEEYSNKAHLSAVQAAIRYSETLVQSQDDEPPNYEPSDEEDDYSRLQNPTKTPIIL